MPLATKPFDECPKCGGLMKEDPVYASQIGAIFFNRLWWTCSRCGFEVDTAPNDLKED